MPSINSLLPKLIADFPDITFSEGESFHWSASDRKVYFEPTGNITSLLHEVAHAVLDHKTYTFDIELLQMERDAWQYAGAVLAKSYDTAIEEETIEIMLDTYRDWLHARSVCPSCQATGIQQKTNLYLCLACDTTWRVNEAKSCALRRYALAST